MDPLSVTAGVIAIVDFSGKVIAACSTYISALKDAPNELFLIRAEVASLRDIVRTLDLPLPQGPQGPGLPTTRNTANTQSLRAPNGTLARCESALKELLDLLVSSAAKRAAGPGQTSKPPSRLHRFAAFRLASLLSLKHTTSGSPNQKLYDDLGWTAFDLASWPSKQKKAKALLGEVMQHKTTIILALEAESRQSLGTVIQRFDQLNVAQAQAQTQAARDVKANILKWLSAPDVMKKHSSVVAGRYPGTCGWVFGLESYVKWSNQGGILWMNGIAGYGKSTVVSSIIQQLQLVLPAKQQQLAYFYFDRDKKDMSQTSDLLRSVVAQLIQQLDIDEGDFVNLFGPDGVAARESFQAPTPEVLENVVTTVASIKKVVLVIDALDECEDAESLLGLIGRFARTYSIDILMSSRPSTLIKKAWDQLTSARPGAYLHGLALSSDMNKGDITAYVTQTVESMVSSKELSLRDPRLREEIIDTLKSRSDGMFQWAASHLRCLPAYCTDHDISAALKELPQGLDNTYEHMLKQLASSTPPRNLRLCRRVFQMLLFAQRPLSLPELAVAISIEPGSMYLPNATTLLTDPHSVLALGGPLVVYKPETNLVQFSHHTIREYLESLEDSASPFHFLKDRHESHSEIAGACLTYIQSSAVLERLRIMKFSDLHGGGEIDGGDLAFVHYAAKYWVCHAQQTTTMASKDKLTTLLYSFFFCPPWPFLVWRAVAEPPWEEWDKQRHPVRLQAEIGQRAAMSAPFPTLMSALGSMLMARRAAASFAPTAPGLGHGSPQWVNAGLKFLKTPGMDERTIAPLDAFHYLARINHPQCLLRLLPVDRPLNLTATGGPLDTTPLHEAAKHGALEFFKVLLDAHESRVDVDRTDILDRTPLFYASQSGHVRVVELLVGRGAVTTRGDWYHSTPLNEAVIRGHHAVVERLLSVSAQSNAPAAAIEATDMSGETPLSKACRFSDARIVSMLARRASGHAIVGAVQACLRWGTSPGTLDALVGTCSKRSWAPGKSPLQELVRERGEGLVQDMQPAGNPLLILDTFLRNGYPVDLEDADGATALAYALRYGPEDIALMLLDRGAQWSKAMRGDEYQDLGAMFLGFVAGGNFKLALLLLNRGAAWDGVDDAGNGFLDMWAAQVVARKGEYRLRGLGPPGNVSARESMPGMEYGAATPALRLLEGVLERGMDINAANSQQRNLLHLLCSSLHGWLGQGIPELRWILHRGGDGSARDFQFRTPLHCLCENTEVHWTQELGQVVGLLTNPVKDIINDCLPPSGTPIHMLVQSSFGSSRLPSFVNYGLTELIKAGASLQVCNERGETPLIMAICGLLRDVEWSRRNSYRLLGAALRLASHDKTANTLPPGARIAERLFAAFGGGHMLASIVFELNLTPSETVVALGRLTYTKGLEILLYSGAQATVTYRDASGCTPLHLQAMTEGENLCDRLRVLLEAGADVTALNNCGETVMDLLRPSLFEARARGVETTDVEALLLRYGANKLDIKVEASQEGWTRVNGRWVKTDED